MSTGSTSIPAHLLALGQGEAKLSSKPLFLWTAPTANGFKPAILLEELKDAYPGKPTATMQCYLTEPFPDPTITL
jgi:hypothetical protein